MKSIFRCVAISMAVFIAMQSIVLGSAQAEPVSIVYLINENFNSLGDGSTPSDATIVSEGNVLKCVSVPDGKNKSLMYQATNGRTAHYNYSFSACQSKLCIEMKLCFENVGNGKFQTGIFNASRSIEQELFHIDENRNLILPDKCVAASFSTDRFYSIAAVVDATECTFNLYVNNKKRATDVALSSSGLKDIASIRFYGFAANTNKEMPVFYLDDIKIYESELPVFKMEQLGIEYEEEVTIKTQPPCTDEELTEYMAGATALYIGTNKVYANDEIMLLDSNDESQILEAPGGTTVVPLSFFENVLLADVDANDDGSIKLVLGDNIVEATVGQNLAVVNGEEKTLAVAPQKADGKIMVPLRDISSFLGNKISYDKSGLIVLADREKFFNLKDDLGVFRRLAGELVYRIPDGNEIIAAVKQNNPNNKHPRIYADDAKMEQIKMNISENPLLKGWFDELKKTADAYLDIAPGVYNKYDGIRILNIATDARKRIEILSFFYRVTGEEKYAVRAYEEMEAMANFPDWNPSHFLDCSELLHALGMGYDWLYNWMNQQQRDFIREALVNKGLKSALDDYLDLPRTRTYLWSQSPIGDNWGLHCNSNILEAALVICDEEEDIAAQIFDYGFENLKKSVALYAPDGAWYEGPGYWHFGTYFFVNLMEALNTSVGDTFGFMDMPGVADTAYFIMGVQGPMGCFNFHDCGTGYIEMAQFPFFGRECDDPYLAQLHYEQLAAGKQTPQWRDILWYDPSTASLDMELQKDWYFRETEIGSMRSGWYDSDSVYLGYHAGRINVYHGQMDAGNFIIDAYGTRFALDLGADDYNIPDSVWNLYRYRAEGHNTLVINPDREGGQNLSAYIMVDRTESGVGEAFATMNMTSAYKGQVDSAWRGFKMFDNREKILVQDEIVSDVPVDLWWFMHTECNIEISSDGKSARLEGGFKDMCVQIPEDTNGVFTVMNAEPMETSPKNDQQNKNAGVKKLALNVKDVTNLTLPVIFSFEMKDTEAERIEYEAVPMAQWEISESDAMLAQAERLLLTDLQIDGQTVEDFSPRNSFYSVELEAGEDIGNIVALSDNAFVEVNKPDSVPGMATIVLTDKNDASRTTFYAINFTSKPFEFVPEGLQKLNIKNLTASAAPQPENAPENVLDNDLNTRWSADGSQYLQFELEDGQTLSTVGVAIWQDTTKDGRQQTFSIQTSDDGISFKTVFTGETTGTTVDKEYYKITPVKAKYVRFVGISNTKSSWTSVTECTLYGNQ